MKRRTRSGGTGPTAVVDGARIERVVAADGVRLALFRAGPADGTPVLLIPGTFSNHTFWFGTRGTGFARTLAAAGFQAWALDPRGHGASDRPGPRDRWDFDDWGRLDVPAAFRFVTDACGPAFIIGHSAGGAVALIAAVAEPALRERIRGFVILGTPLPWLQPVARLLSRSARAFSRLAGRFPARILRLGPEDELGGVMAQWMTWQIEGHWRGDDGTDYEAGLRPLRALALVITGAGDRFEAPPPAVHALFSRLGSADRSFLLCGRSTGFSTDFDHAGLVVSRAARAEIWPRILEWLAHRSPPARP